MNHRNFDGGRRSAEPLRELANGVGLRGVSPRAVEILDAIALH